MDPRWRISHTRGYLELGMLKDAAAELAALPASFHEDPEVITLSLALYQQTEDWAALKSVASRYARLRPNEPSGWIMWAYATRRADSLEQAEKILTEGRTLHPNDPTMAFNLGCYACLRGDLPAAHRWVAHAITLDKRFREIAAQDPDLAALRAARQPPA